ncbi:MAG: hypothetical protein AVDCRST_MAG09-1137 [uncultured Sphingomonas sp.]|uniref:YdhG-like domain-containing protein n=1 Tax=uncultured Sphingomonas sp. TaxID=158754 RepID=A0A6J4SWU7_9SPHN|nr:DUF1801 domain-containing protein [uncultured Sphingomonas sp.]CAA9507365.1 MAG: hypothetical protein AVDCRST_MAG09-1137 [uncultured Sphingomonas sp.]
MGAKASPLSLPEALLAGLPPERAEALAHARQLVNDALLPGYEESVSGKMIVWSIPLSRYPNTYNKQPLQLAALAAQKNHNALYLMCTYMSPERMAALQQAYTAAGKKLDMGKSCLRFRTADELCDKAVSAAIAAVPVETYIRDYEAARHS